MECVSRMRLRSFKNRPHSHQGERAGGKERPLPSVGAGSPDNGKGIPEHVIVLASELEEARQNLRLLRECMGRPRKSWASA